MVDGEGCSGALDRSPSRSHANSAGGECEGNHRTIWSAEVYDPNRNRWASITEMNTGMIPFIGIVDEDKWFLKGLDSHRQVVSEVYAPTANTWSTVSGTIVAGWRNPSISLNGIIYASDCRDGCMLRVYEPATDSWVRFMDSKNHLGNSQAFEAATFVALNGKLGIIRNNMSMSLVDVTEPVNIIETNSARVWEALAGKGQLKNFVAKFMVLHCRSQWSEGSYCPLSGASNFEISLNK